MKRVIFLDVDGVLNNESTREQIGSLGGAYAKCTGIDKRLLKLFLDWLKGKPIELVLSSTWRIHSGHKRALRQAGLDWIGETPNRGYRGREVEEWLRDNPADAYAILDDIQQFFPYQHKHFVQTSYIHGLRAKNLKKVESILGL